MRAGRGRPVRARVRVRAGRALRRPDPGARARRRPPPRREVPDRRRPRRRRPGALAALQPARRLRPRRRGGQRVRGRGLPDDHVRRPRRPRRRLDRRPGEPRRTSSRGCGALGEPPDPRRRRRARRSRPSCPGWGCAGASSAWRATCCDARRRRCGSGCAGCRTGIAARPRSRCAAARSRTPTGRCSGTSASNPDEDRIPVEALMLERLKRGAYRSRGLLADALHVATLDTEVGRVGGRRGPARRARRGWRWRAGGSSSPASRGCSSRRPR